MRPMRNGEGFGGGNLTEKQSEGLEHVQEVWDEWEIQCLILLSLSLQVFLYLTADLRRRSASRTLTMVLWLAYLSADTVAVFALGHLAVHAQGPGHELMFFWAPFVLVHLGGQDNITALSKQDNELWPRHLLNLVTQAAVAGYVVSKSSWPDARLRAAMVLMFLSGFLKYAGRTFCLYSASPRSLGDQSRVSLWGTIEELRKEREKPRKREKLRKEQEKLRKEQEKIEQTISIELRKSSINSLTIENLQKEREKLWKEREKLQQEGWGTIEELRKEREEREKLRKKQEKLLKEQEKIEQTISIELRKSSIDSLTIEKLQKDREKLWKEREKLQKEREKLQQEGTILERRFENMFIADKLWEFIIYKKDLVHSADDIMSVDAPVNDVKIIALAPFLPDTLEKYKNRPDRWMAYQYVAACLVQSYQCLYTKASSIPNIWSQFESQFLDHVLGTPMEAPMAILFVLTYTLFHSISALIALVLFLIAEKEGRHSKVDVTVSYILFAGAIVLDLLPFITSIFSYARRPFRPGTAEDCEKMCSLGCVQPPGWRRTTKQWSEQLAQYSMLTRYTSSMPSLVKWIGAHLGASWCLELFELTRTRVTDDLKLVVLDKLFLEAERKMWDIASSRGERALVKVFPESERSDCALHKSISSKVDFPTSVLIWHIATDICYFVTEDNDTEPAEIKKKKNSRELSHYIMYLVFKCDVMLTSSSRLVHQKAHEGLAYLLSAGQQSTQIKKEAVIQVFEGMKKEKQQQRSSLGMAEGNKNEESANNNAAAASISSQIEELLRSTEEASTSRQIEELLRSTEEALYSPVLTDAREVAQKLIDINGEAQRWQLILEVWLEMLFYTAPRCGAAFHYEHLSTGGEFISHVLLLMRELGPFLPKPGS
ncbi:hypothetical protein PVAP13_1KG095854 [Panicum virgatum]|uniref:DUF4220 domain-containing protein n=1 Tax=Panicum virgatum TaxID=38727 RepID=A0A8T0XH17_PANVG|nr:hypothetical protein PVAP13_1KG095854 [Panicum virgatum]